MIQTDIPNSFEDINRFYCITRKDEVIKLLTDYFDRCTSLPEHIKILSWEDKDFKKSLKVALAYIKDLTYEGDLEAESLLRSIEYSPVLEIDERKVVPRYRFAQDNLKYNREVANKGDVYAMAMLADKYYVGKKIAQCYDKVFELYLKAAEGGVETAQYNVARCYELGLGTDKDLNKAIYWFTYAAENGISEAKRSLLRIELQKSNTPEDLTSYLPSYVIQGEIESAVIDEYGVKYSADGKRLLKAPRVLKSYVVKDGTQVICDNAFASSKKLSAITIPEGVKVIGSRCFRMCKQLKSLQLPQSLREIQDEAFNLSGVVSIVIPDNVKTIGECAFANCEKITSLRIGKSVSKIGRCFLTSHYNVSTLEVDPENHSYDSRNNCNAIIETATNTLILGCSTTVIPDTIAAIGDYAFMSQKIKSITIPSSVKTIGKYAFSCCDKLQVLDMVGVESIEEHAFEDCSKLKTLKLPDTLKTIGTDAFSSCELLENIELSNSLKTIGCGAFSYCESLKEISLPDSITRIEDFAFDYSNLESVKIPSGVKILSSFIFHFCLNLREVFLSDGIKMICKDAFLNCFALEKVFLPASVERINSPFDNCNSLSAIEVAPENQWYDSRNNCNAIIETATNTLIVGIKETTIPDTVTDISEYAFYGSGLMLKSITIPDSVRNIGRCAFYSCVHLEKVVMHRGVKSIGESAFGVNDSLMTIILPDTLEYIGVAAFANCGAIAEIEFPKSLKIIDREAFRDCRGLTKLVIPESVEKIGAEAFADCFHLEKVEILNSSIEIEEDAFLNCDKLVNVSSMYKA